MIIEEFKTHQELLDKLISQKYLIVDDLGFAEQKLKELGYFNIVGGYKEPFIDPNTKLFIKGTTFKDLYELYSFDKQLKQLFMTYLCQIERRIAVSLAYAFTELYGNAQSKYLDINNYNNIPQNTNKINKLIKILEKAVADDKHNYIIHQRNTKNNVSLRILVNALTLGNISNLYVLSKPPVKSKVSHNFEGVNEKQLEQYLKVLVLFRNICAHNERLFSAEAHSDIPNTELHKKLNIPLNGNQYEQGKRDLFCLVIAFR